MTKLRKTLLAILIITVSVFGITGIAANPAKALSANDLGDLFILTMLFGKNDSSGILNNGGGVDLGNMIIISQLFGNGGLLSGSAQNNTGKSGLGQLLILNQLFGNSNLFGLSGTQNNLGRLFVLDRLFGGGTNGIFSGNILSNSAAATRTTTGSSVVAPAPATSATTTVTTTPVTAPVAPTAPTPTPTPPVTTATSTATSTAPTTERVVVNIQNNSYVPETITVSPGTSVVWINQDLVTHTITSDNLLFDSSSLNNSQSYQVTFRTLGKFDYHCKLHPEMKGTVIVKL